MRKIWQHKKYIVLAFALVCVLAAATVGSALAYFTTYTYAEGRKTLSLGVTTTTNEEAVDMYKNISISNAAESNPAYVRVQVFAGSDITVSMIDENDSWTDGQDGWWYYNKILGAGETTDILRAEVTNVAPDVAESFEIIVVHESVQAFDDTVSAMNADWTAASTIEGGDE